MLHLIERDAETTQSCVDLNVDGNNLPWPRGADHGFGTCSVDQRWNQPGTDQISHPRRQSAREHYDWRANACRAHLNGLVKSAGHERGQTLPVKRLRNCQSPMPVGVGFKRGNARLTGANATTNFAQVRAQTVHVIHGPRGMRVIRHTVSPLKISKLSQTNPYSPSEERSTANLLVNSQTFQTLPHDR